MADEKLHTRTLEMRMMMGLLWKASLHALNQWLQENDMDLTHLQLGVLRMLDHHGPHTISELSRNFAIDPSTLVPTVDALERKGWLSRGRDPDDRRRVPLALTDEGRTVLQSVPVIRADDPLLGALEAVGEEEVEQILSLLHRLVVNIPDGEQMLKDAEQRLIAHGAKERYLKCKQFNET